MVLVRVQNLNMKIWLRFNSWNCIEFVNWTQVCLSVYISYICFVHSFVCLFILPFVLSIFCLFCLSVVCSFVHFVILSFILFTELLFYCLFCLFSCCPVIIQLCHSIYCFISWVYLPIVLSVVLSMHLVVTLVTFFQTQVSNMTNNAIWHTNSDVRVLQM